LQPVDHGLIAAFRAYSSKPSWQWWEFWTSQTQLSRIIGAHSTIWRTLITSMQLGRKCQWTVWMEVHFTLIFFCDSYSSGGMQSYVSHT
jgi:hypothetical protein